MDDSTESSATRVRTRVRTLERPVRHARGVNDLTNLVNDLLGDDLETRLSALSDLASNGKKGAEVLSRRLARTTDPYVQDTLLAAIEEIQRPAFEPLLSVFARLNEPRSSLSFELIEDMARSLVYLGDRKAIPAVLEHLRRLKALAERSHEARVVERCHTTRLRLLLLLAEVGVSDGLPELLSLLKDGARRVPEAVVDALARIGDRRALLPLLRLHALEKRVSDWGARQIQTAFRTIARREHVGPNDPLFAGAAAAEKEALDRWIPKARKSARHH